MRSDLAVNVASESAQLDLDDYIEPFESARVTDSDVDLARFGPDKRHPKYAQIMVELLRVDLEYCWQRGERDKLVEYQSRFPDVLSVPDHLQQVAFEEFRLRRLAGENVSPDEYRQGCSIPTDTWPDLPVGEEFDTPRRDDLGNSWDGGLSDIDRDTAGRLAIAERQLPKVGDRFLDFELAAELGEGAFGRVYLARQGDLANRFVALKITAQLSDEPHRLAQLQHTNIVPIYSLHNLGPLQAVCMPFLGPNTLADVLRTFQISRSIPVSGKALVNTMAARQLSTVVREATKDAGTEQDGDPDESSRAPDGIRLLGTMTYQNAVAWIAWKVAAGLAHAHEHGIVHRDLKPANILLTDDGEPLILDFNLASRETALTPSTALVGGTLPYMAPEHIEALRSGGVVDARSDVYSLGVILFEMLTGQCPYPIRRGTVEQAASQMLDDRKTPAPSVRSLNKAVMPDLDSIVSRCLALDSSRRYVTARQLQEDLERHVGNRPLLHAPNRSIAQRVVKWVRRHPRLSSATSIASLSVVVIVALVAVLWMRGVRIAQNEALESLRMFQADLATVRASLNVPLASDDALGEDMATAERALARYGVLSSTDWRQTTAFVYLAPADRKTLERDTCMMLYLLAAGKAQQAVRNSDDDSRRQMLDEALRLNDVAQQTWNGLTVPRAYLLQRARFVRRAGRADEADKLRRQASDLPPSGERDEYLAAVESAENHDYRAAAGLLQQLLLRSPQDWKMWHGLGGCYFSMRRFGEAEGCYSTCIALRPELHVVYSYRGISRLEQEKYAAARDDFEHVLQLRPGRPSALVNRALASRGLGETEEAIEDLTLALQNGATQTRVYFLRSRLKLQIGDKQGAQLDREEGLRSEPSDELSWVARGVAQLKNDPERALDDFRSALKVSPGSRPAFQNIAHVLSDRLGRNDEAIETMDRIVALEPDDPASLASRGVLLARVGASERAHADGDAALKTGTEPLTIYQVGCIFSLTSRHQAEDGDRAVQLIAAAMKKDPSLVNIAARDPDLAPLREDARFRRLIGAAQTLDRAAK